MAELLDFNEIPITTCEHKIHTMTDEEITSFMDNIMRGGGTAGS